MVPFRMARLRMCFFHEPVALVVGTVASKTPHRRFSQNRHYPKLVEWRKVFFSLNTAFAVCCLRCRFQCLHFSIFWMTGLFGSFFHSSVRIFWRSWKALAEHSYTHGPCSGCAGSTMGRRKNALFLSRVFLYSGGRIAPLHSGRSSILRASARLFFCSGVVL